MALHAKNNCKLSTYSEETNHLNCSCTVSEEINNMNQKFNAKKIYESFVDVFKFSNYKVLKCSKLVFSKNPFPKNKGLIIILIYILIHLVCGITYIIKGIAPLNTKLELNIKDSYINQELININEKDITINEKIINNNIQIKEDINDKKNLDNLFPPKRKTSFLNYGYSKIVKGNTINDNQNDKSNNNNLLSIKRKVIRRRNKSNISYTGKSQVEASTKSYVNPNINNNKQLNNHCSSDKIIVNNIPIEKDTKDEKINEKNVQKNLDNFELNDLEFNEAIQLDQRTFLQIYWSILRREHPILFTFFTWKDYNLIYIKLTRFFFLIANDMALNVFFFSDESMHKLYINYGKYDFIQKIPQIIYTTIVSRLIEVFLCFLSLTDKHIYQVKTLIVNKSIESKKYKLIYRCIKIKLISFFCFTFIMFLSYLYIVACFCAVYENTQISFIKDCIFSFLIGIFIPFVLYLIPPALRIYAIKNPKRKTSIYFYKLSDLIPIF